MNDENTQFGTVNPASFSGQTTQTPPSQGMNPKTTLSEAEARLLLQAETQKTQKSLTNHNQKQKKLLITALVLAVVICVATLAMVFVLR